MAGIIVELLLSYLLLKYVAKQNLSVLGLIPGGKKWSYLIAGFLLPFAYFSALYMTLSIFGGNPYKINPEYSWSDFFTSFSYVLKAVIFEELIFRGALLYILIIRIGSVKAIIISAISFGIYHWFSYGIIGKAIPMLQAFLMTGIMGYLFALAYKKTRSVLLPFAIHFGINFTGMILFSRDKNIGLQLLIKSYQKDPLIPGAVISILLMIIYYIGFYIVCYLWLRKLNK